MSDRSKLINRLLKERDFRAAYIRAKLDVLVPSQLRALRLRQDKTQSALAQSADMKQARISAMETPGRVNFNLETLVRMAATLNVGLMVKFIPVSEMLTWENDYSQDSFNVTQLANDIDFFQPASGTVHKRSRRRKNARLIQSAAGMFQTPIATGGIGSVQMKLQFELFESLPIQTRLGKVLTLPNRSRSALDDLLIPKASAAVGGGRYGNGR